jgi:hypothetical protein
MSNKYLKPFREENAMAILTVGIGQQYSTITAGLHAALAGDTVNVQAGSYINDFPDTINQTVNLIGIGGMAHMSATTAVPNGKALLVIGNDSTSTCVVTISNFELSNVTVASNNGAGIRYQGGSLILNDCFLHDNQEGILGGANQTTGTVTINNTEFYNNGYGDGQTHNIYLEVGTLNLNNVYSHSAIVGHELKSRSGQTTIINSRFQDENGTASYCLDFPNGGNVSVTGCTIQKGINASNHTCLIAYGEEGAVQANSALLIRNNVLINDCAALHEAVWNASSVAALITNNSQWAVTTMLVGAGTVTATITLPTAPKLITTPPVAPPAPTVASVVALCSKLHSQLAQANLLLATIVTNINLL